MKRQQITTVEQVIECATQGRSLVCPQMWGDSPKPAAFIQNFIGRTLAAAFSRGLYVYEPFKGGIGAKFGRNK